MIDKRIKKKNDCTGCGACQNMCPFGCIEMKEDSEGFRYPNVEYDKCIKCGKCINVCPVINKAIVNRDPKAYACINKDESIRIKSSSGGIFTLLAEYVIKNKGVVFGAAFDDKFELKHCYVETVDGIEQLRGSKYLQSQIGETYKQARNFLEEAREVLFSGTPCQIGGLKSYLRKDYDNLICVDIICHGVPSPKVWKKYLEYREDKFDSPIHRVSFKDKNKGWKKTALSFFLKNDKEYRETLDKDLYMRAFLKDVCLRPSCYYCEFKGLNRQSDITLADFWGIQNILPEMDDDKGTSLLFVNTDVGQKVFKSLAEKIEFQEVDIDEAVRHNSAAVKSSRLNPNRAEFLKDLDSVDFDKLVRKYCTEKLSFRLIRRGKLFIRKVLDKLGLLDFIKRVMGNV